MHELDCHLAALGRAEIDHDLKALESAVWAKIDARSRRSLRPMPTGVAASICAGMALLASLAGVAVAAARTESQTTVFTVQAPLAPSTVLGN